MNALRLRLLVALVVVSGLGSTFAAPDCAQACSCGVPAGVSLQELARQELRGSDAVFAGEVTDIDKPRLMTSSLDPMKVTFQVAEAWKGAGGETVDVKTAVSDASCGYPFEEGKNYLVFASEGPTYGKGGLEVALCRSTKPLPMADAELAALGPGEAPTGTSATGDRLPETSGVLPGLADPVRVLLFASGAALVVAAFARWSRGRIQK